MGVNSVLGDIWITLAGQVPFTDELYADTLSPEHPSTNGPPTDTEPQHRESLPPPVLRGCRGSQVTIYGHSLGLGLPLTRVLLSALAFLTPRGIKSLPFQNMKSLFALLSCATTALAASRTSAPAGCITAGSGSSYSTIQAAVNSLSTSASGTQCIFIKPGTYKEQVLVPARSAQLTIYGSTTDTTGYAANSVTITGSKSQADGLSNDETATLRVKAANFKLYNVNVANTYGKGSQAVALSAYADSGYYGNAFTGYQDTLLANTGKQLYAGNLIQGATDFIFGQNAPAWFENNDIRVVSASLGYITGKTTCSTVDWWQ